MSATVTTWLAITVLLGVLASFAIWARGYSHARGLAVVAFLLASPVSAAALGYSLGWSVPYVAGVTVPEGKHPILGVKMIIGEGIYILLDTGPGEPRYYKFPWSRETAEKLQNGMDADEQMGVEVPPWEWSWDQNAPKFYADPQPKMLPDKPRQEAAPNYEQSI